MSRMIRGVCVLALALAGCAGTQKTSSAAGAEGGERPKERSGSKSGEQAAGSKADKPQGDKAPAVPQVSPRAQRLFDEAVQSFNEQRSLKVQDWNILEKKFRAAADADDKLGEAWYDLGVIYEKQRRYDDARSAYKTALERKPSLKQASENLAVMLQNEGKTSDAVGIYREILKQWPDDGAARARLAAIYLDEHQHEPATKLAREALMREPTNLTAYKVLMRVSLERNNYSMAKLVALRARNLAKQDPELMEVVAQILLKEGDEEGSVAQLREAVAARDDYLLARLKLAEIATRHQDWSNALEQYKKIAQYDPKSPAAHNNLAVAFKGLGQYDKAMAEYEQAIKLDPNVATPYFNYGVLFQRHKDAPEKALEYYKKFLAASRDNVPGDHPVFGAIKECEQLIRQMGEAKAAEDQAKREAEEKKRQEAEKQRADEEAKRAAERQKRQQQAKESLDAAMGPGPAPADAKAPPPPAPEPKAAPAAAEERPAKTNAPAPAPASDEPVGP